MRSHHPAVALVVALFALAAGLTGAGLSPTVEAQSDSFEPIAGEGSTFSEPAIDAMIANVEQFGITVDYTGTGSSSGRKNWSHGIVDFAASDIPFQFEPEDGSEPDTPAEGSYAYIPVTAGGTAFVYNLRINGQRVTNLRLSGENVAKIFTGVITEWNDPALAADNPGLQLPARPIVPVVRSDGSGSTAQFTAWMIDQYPQLWNDYCKRAGRSEHACGTTSYYPMLGRMLGQLGDTGVAAYVSEAYGEGAIGYASYAYSLRFDAPVAKVLNHAGYYTEPTPENVAVSLLKATINNDEDSDEYLTQQLDGVYSDTDPRNYPLSSYSYFILPTVERPSFGPGKGRTLSTFAYYAMCQAQQQSASLGFSPIPINLVEASFDQIRKIPGAEVQNINVQSCDNPTFSTDGTNTLAQNAPQPQPCDKQGPQQCATGTGGVPAVDTPVAGQAGGGTTGGTASGESAGGVGGTASGGVAGSGAGAGADQASGAGDGAVAGADAGITTEESQGSCDPDTGECGLSQRSGTSGDAAVGAVVPTTLDQDPGFGRQEGLIIVVVLLALSLIFVPAYFWRAWSSPSSTAEQASLPAPEPEAVTA